MKAEEIIKQLKDRGAVLRALGDRLEISPAAAINRRLASEIKSRGSEILMLLREGARSTERLEDTRACQNTVGLLYLMMGQSVLTPEGRGVLVQVLDSGYAAVAMQKPQTRVMFFCWDDVWQ